MPGGKTDMSNSECETDCSITNGINGKQKIDYAGQDKRGETHVAACLYSALQQTM